MHVRVVTFTGAKDIDAGIKFLEETVKPALNSQKGYRGFTASADREGGVIAVLSLWDAAEDRDASEAALASSRQEALGVIGGEMRVENFEQLVAEVGDPPPEPGSALMLTRISMDPGKIDENLAFFKSDVAPRMKASPGFRGMRNMMDRSTGEGIVGTVWSDGDARKRAADEAMSRRSEGVARGVTFGEVSFREILTVDLKCAGHRSWVERSWRRPAARCCRVTTRRLGSGSWRPPQSRPDRTNLHLHLTSSTLEDQRHTVETA